MWKEKMRKYAVVEYKWVLAAKAAIIILAAVSAGMLAFFGRDYGRSPLVTKVVVGTQKSTASRDKMKPVILKWMKDNSKVPEQVLSKIYDEALNKAHPDLILAICMVESNFNPVVTSNKGAIGLMGVMPTIWFEELKEQGIVRNKSDLFQISNNMDSGLYVLRKYLERSNDLEQALMDYVGGDMRYAGKVMNALAEISTVKMLNAQSFSAEAKPAG